MREPCPHIPALQGDGKQTRITKHQPSAVKRRKRKKIEQSDIHRKQETSSSSGYSPSLYPPAARVFHNTADNVHRSDRAVKLV